MAKFRVGDIVTTNCKCKSAFCKSGPSTGIVVGVQDDYNFVSLVFPPDTRPLGFRQETVILIGHMNETDIPAPLPEP